MFKFDKIEPSQKSNYHLNSIDNNIWISSTDGLNIYDGKFISVYNSGNSGIIGNNIQSNFFEDEEDSVWFTTFVSLVKYNKRSLNFTSQQLEYNNVKIKSDYSIIGQSKDELLLKAGKIVCTYNTSVDSITANFNFDLSGFSTFSKAIRIGNSYYLLANTVDNTYFIKIDLINSKIDTLHELKSPNSKPQIYNDSLFIFASDIGELYSLNPVNSELHKLQDHNERIFNIHIYKDSILSILFDKRIEQYRLSDLQQLHSIPLNIEGTKTTIYMDPNETIWVSIDGKGIFSFNINKVKFKHLTNTFSDKPANARSLIQMKNGDIYYSSRDNGIGVMDSSYTFIKQYNTHTSNINSNFVLKIDQNSDDKLYAISGNRILQLNNGQFQKIELDNNSFYYDMLVNINDDLILIGSDSNEIFKVIQTQENIYSKEPVLDKYPDNYIVSAFELKDSSLVIGVNAQSIYLYTLCQDRYCYTESYDISSDIKSIWEVPGSNEIYLSSSSGLYHFQHGFEGGFSKIKDSEGLLNQCIYYILGHKNELWLSSNKGLLRYNSLTQEVHKFTEADGIQGQEYNTTSGLIDQNGYFIFGGTNGINIFHPDSVQYLDYSTPIYISNFLVNDEKYTGEINPNFIENIKFNYTDNTLSFWFHGIDHSDPSNVNLRYKLEDYDPEWVYINENNGQIRYANLPPGKYNLKLHASNSDGIWSRSIKNISITITPPFWQTLWFRILAILSIAFLIWTLIRLYYKRKLREKDLLLREQRLYIEKQEALQAERNRIASEMHDDLGGGLTSIKFLSHKVLKQKDKDPTVTLNKIIDQSHRLIDNMSEIIWAMNAGNDTLNNLLFYLRDYTIKFLSDFNIKHEITFAKCIEDIPVSGEKRRNIFLIYKESLHNIVKHADADFVKINSELIHDRLFIAISDNGKGFDSEVKANGNGMLNIQKRINQLNGEYTIESGTKGTTLNFSIPIG